MIEITHAVVAHEIETVRLLLMEYQAQLDVDLAYQDFETEVRHLPGAYAGPSGRLLLATLENQPVGMVALRDAGGGRAEMKRLFVRPTGRGHGVGRALVARLLREARAARYEEVVLDTLPSMQSAQRLYEQFGFVDIPAYRASPVPGTRYLGLTLGVV
ncbi:GNAT family N-acetyltransferase [Gemmatimonas phototrophica]|uniref:Acetyltransferase n=1 Tax=Gemmatimonas phototrophica TaxID=1379270 RepID=A0A143BP41_9BACT|nr:GNAT family N-acetyltransferase [Gemmatimonas phototrophica]AMW06393.1 acetyltransferase [Gemmatimonas phototrophica]